MFFQNLQNPDVQQQIKTLCLGKSGVYKITNLKNHKIYVGSAITKTPKGNRLYIRFRNHFFNHHKQFPIKKAILKDRVSNFSWEILEWTPPSSTRIRESNYIQTLQPEYNILESAESSSGHRHTPETREKMKIFYSEERRHKIGALNGVKKGAPEILEKISQAARNKTAEKERVHKKACLLLNQNNLSKPIQALHGETRRVVGTYPSLKGACRAWNGDYRTFKRAVKSGFKIKKLEIYVKYVS